MAIAEHDPSKLYKKNRGVAKMSKQELHEFAATKTIGEIHARMSKKKK